VGRGDYVSPTPNTLLYVQQFNTSICYTVLYFLSASRLTCSFSSFQHVYLHLPDTTQSLTVTRWFVSKTRPLNLVGGCNILRLLIKFEIDFETPHGEIFTSECLVLFIVTKIVSDPT
jgi:hypothetical protein